MCPRGVSGGRRGTAGNVWGGCAVGRRGRPRTRAAGRRWDLRALEEGVSHNGGGGAERDATTGHILRYFSHNGDGCVTHRSSALGGSRTAGEGRV